MGEVGWDGTSASDRLRERTGLSGWECCLASDEWERVSLPSDNAREWPGEVGWDGASVSDRLREGMGEVRWDGTSASDRLREKEDQVDGIIAWRATNGEE